MCELYIIVVLKFPEMMLKRVFVLVELMAQTG